MGSFSFPFFYQNTQNLSLSVYLTKFVSYFYQLDEKNYSESQTQMENQIRPTTSMGLFYFRYHRFFNCLCEKAYYNLFV